MKKIIATTALVAVLTVGASAQAAEFVTNGKFTTLSNGVGQLGTSGNTTATGWSVNNGANASYEFIMTSATAGATGQFGSVKLWDQANGGANGWDGLAAHGGNFAALDGAYQDSPLSQVITGLVVGKTYALSYDYAFAQQTGFDGATTQNLKVSLGNFNSTTPNLVLANHGFSGWTTATFNIVATAATETLSFYSVATPQQPPFALVGSVSLKGAVPEPATWAMMLVGFGGLGAMIRKRRAATAAAL
ncbi:PEPxxWA-CTERM sorting domain-containing protein [Phenylobacterium sp.]|uniref:PEPxxWA-CTERM sorting domain-containing protein n=1 Tax=Phenylobacterium sp. TaxID=1871053 RepID=UPI00374CD0E8